MTCGRKAAAVGLCALPPVQETVMAIGQQEFKYGKCDMSGSVCDAELCYGLWQLLMSLQEHLYCICGFPDATVVHQEVRAWKNADVKTGRVRLHASKLARVF